jgi:hypothetical protein
MGYINIMKRNMVLIVILVLSTFIFSGSAQITLPGYEYEEAVVINMYDRNSDEFMLSKTQPAGYQLIVGDTSKGVLVYGKKIGNLPYYERVLIKTRSAQREFGWKATSRNPRLIVSDVTGSGEESIVLIFVTALGTGFLQSDVHVVNMSLTREIPVMEPVLAAKRLITSSVQGKEIVFKSGGVEYRTRPGGELGGEYSNLLYGSIVSYSVENNRLMANMTVQTALGKFLGTFTLTYSYSGGMFVPRVTGFKSI